MAAGSVRIWAIAALALVLVGAAVCEAVHAAGRGGSGRGGASGGHRSHSGKNHSGHHHNGNNTSAVAAGVFVGGPWWPWWDYPAYYAQIAVAAVPVVYIERSEQEGQAATDWLYCAAAQSYFPYVDECAQGWERVPVTPIK